MWVYPACKPFAEDDIIMQRVIHDLTIASDINLTFTDIKNVLLACVGVLSARRK